MTPPTYHPTLEARLAVFYHSGKARYFSTRDYKVTVDGYRVPGYVTEANLMDRAAAALRNPKVENVRIIVDGDGGYDGYTWWSKNNDAPV